MFYPDFENKSRSVFSDFLNEFFYGLNNFPILRTISIF